MNYSNEPMHTFIGFFGMFVALFGIYFLIAGIDNYSTEQITLYFGISLIVFGALMSTALFAIFFSQKHISQKHTSRSCCENF